MAIKQTLTLTKDGFSTLKKAKGPQPVLIEWKDILEPGVENVVNQTRRAISDAMKGQVQMVETQFVSGDIKSGTEQVLGRITEKTRQGIKVRRIEQPDAMQVGTRR